MHRKAAELLAYLPNVQRVDAHTIGCELEDMVATSQFLQFLLASGALPHFETRQQPLSKTLKGTLLMPLQLRAPYLIFLAMPSTISTPKPPSALPSGHRNTAWASCA